MNMTEVDQSKLYKQCKQIPWRVHTGDTHAPSLTELNLTELVRTRQISPRGLDVCEGL